MDKDSNQLFMSTGNNYAVPTSVLSCLAAGTVPSQCMDPANHFDSIIALNMDTGAINWGARGLPSDVWNVACGLYIPGLPIGPGIPYTPGVYGNCPNSNPATAGPDYDFAQGPMLLGGGLVGAGQKSGKFWAFNLKTGALAWSQQAGPPGITGGLQWGSANNGNTIFVAVANAGTSLVPAPAGSNLGLKLRHHRHLGWVVALDRRTGAILWTRGSARKSSEQR